MKPELVSFKICPFVQRSVIVLKEKGADYDITYINLKEPPEWFREISPLGKVPLLKVGDAVVFESAVIMEYLDEVNPPSLHPTDPLRKAHNRAWIEFASTLFMCQFNMVMAKEQEACDSAEQELRDKLKLVDAQLAGPFFNGNDFSLVDAAYAPLFMRMALLEQWCPMGLMEGLPKMQVWSETLLARPAVQNSVVDELPQLYRGHIGSSGGYGAKRFGTDNT
ncbi:MAG: glutathione S-transferase family protein [Chromatiales bacterium]|nr:glutathione S-transferase family protein [Chromatiales bacterium]